MCSVDEMLWRNSVLVTQIVAASAGIVKRAGKIVRSVAGTDLKIVQKDQDHEVEAVSDDLVSDEVDNDVLQKCQHRNSEFDNTDLRDVVVWVDPLDGTLEFTEGLFDHVTILVGVAVKGKAIGGIIHQPFYGFNVQEPSQWGRTIWGVVGVGAFGLTPAKPPEKRIIATTRSHSNKNVNSAIESLQPDEIVRVGGAGYKVVLAIEGLVSAYVFASPGCKKWDTCGPEAVLAALGGKLTDISGNALQYHSGVQYANSGGVLATPNGVDHDWYVQRIPEETKASLPQVTH